MLARDRAHQPAILRPEESVNAVKEKDSDRRPAAESVL